MRHPVGDRPVKPKFLGGAAPEIEPGQDYRAALADWLASPDNAAFARNVGNIVWAHFFGKGIVDPVDDVRVSNPASNPELLDALGKKAAEYKFDVKKLARDICLSRTYQLSTKRNPTNEWDERNFARQAVRRMRAEVLLDCITQVTETTNRFPGLPLGGAGGADPRRPHAELLPDHVRPLDPRHGLHLRGEDLADAVAGAAPAQRRDDDRQDRRGRGGREAARRREAIRLAVAEELYLRCLGRKPTAAEAERIAVEARPAGPDKKQALEDLFWALLNTNEFIFNH